MTEKSTTKSLPPGSKRPEDAWLPVPKLFAYGLQHVLTMYGGIIAVPLIIGKATGVDGDQLVALVTASLFVGGIATLIQSIGFPLVGSKLPLIQGVSFAGVATMLAILTGGGSLSDIFGAVIVASVIGFVVAPFFARIIRFFPPVVTGVVITAIGLTLIPTAANWAMGGDEAAADYGSVQNIALAFITFAVILLLSKVGSAAISRLSILLGLIIGTGIGAAMGMTDFSEVGQGAPVAIPGLLPFGAPTFDLAAIGSMLIVILVIKTETAADVLAVGEIIGTPVDKKRVAAGLRADMASSVIAPFFGSFTQSAFAQNVGLVALTGVRSRFVVSAGGVILILLGLMPVLGQVVAAVPMPVLGGAGFILFGTVSGSGIRNLKEVKFEGNMNLIIVSASLAFALVPVVKPDFYEHFPSWVQTIFHSGISSAAIMAVLLNLLFNELRFGNSTNASVYAAKPARFLTPSNLKDLREGDKFIDGKFVDCDGEEIPLVPDEKAEEIQAAIDCGDIVDTASVKQVVTSDSDNHR
ncbi:nucleobase:cation symporter-2 family protein [Brevibacterium aurantiacum]|uniref:Uracil permease n=1 Tax=Brevibacterium aurantiacum TaxID=273384 RepID=A0A3Q8ST84_BREAU|nr:nucleobase:cation symporter-2 family protein [Brevibacterium aurantiacum]AZL04876.1 uracil permease [Brevibacterium aurantiacum]AZT96295.1 uracil permease [Brevibacterium aurantiacum]